jgi:putative nucleotidyltransferase with HDIG domain
MMGMTVDAFAKEIRSSVIGRTIWEHSLAVGLLVKELSRKLGMRGAEEGFICGLLHDIGKIMLLRADAETYSQILDKKTENEMPDWETETFGYNHAQVGALVVNRWQLPEMICHVILNHHNPSQSTESVFIGHLINVADALANYNGYGLRLEADPAILNSESSIMLRLTEEDLHAAWDNIQTDLDEVTGAFS